MSSRLFELITLTRSQHARSSNLFSSASVLRHTWMSGNVTISDESKIAAVDRNIAYSFVVGFLAWISNTEWSWMNTTWWIGLFFVSDFLSVCRFVQLCWQLDDCTKHQAKSLHRARAPVWHQVHLYSEGHKPGWKPQQWTRETQDQQYVKFSNCTECFIIN